jgi:hypothetical protein
MSIVSIPSQQIDRSQALSNGWDRRPAPALAREHRRLARRQYHLAERIRGLVERKTSGSDLRVLNRADMIADLVVEFREVENRLNEIERG